MNYKGKVSTVVFCQVQGSPDGSVALCTESNLQSINIS